MKSDAIAEPLPTGALPQDKEFGSSRNPTDWYTDSEGHEMTARLYGRPVKVRLSPTALAASRELVEPLTIEMELYFSCFVRKAVRFRTGPTDVSVPAESRTVLNDNLILQFRPATTRHCSMSADEAAPPLETMPVKRPQAFLPRWIDIDFKRGKWLGEYGY